MKLASRDESVIIRSNEFEEEEFVLEATSDAYDLLSRKIYSDPILAVIRELSTNARDSHVEANKADVPFFVSLPGKFDPEFRLRDWGTGIPPEKIKTVYKRYFVSTRTASDAYTGMLGLGSKSPLAYTDNFSVINYYDGIKYTYSIFINAKGIPAIALISKEETSEINGLEIKIAVEPRHFDEFHKKAIQIYRFFRVQPDNFPVKRPEPWLSGADWDFYVKPLSNEEKAVLDGPHVIMGDVVYPISIYEIPYDIRNKFQNKALLLRFDIGELDITGNRENLHYSAKTINALKARFHVVEKQIKKAFENKINELESHWEAACCVDHCANYVPYDCQPGLYRGEELKTNFSLGCRIEYYARSGSKRVKREEQASIGASWDVLFVENDLKKKSAHNILRWNMFNKYSARTFAVLSPEDTPNVVAKLGIKPESVLKVSTFEKPPVRSYERSGLAPVIKTLVYDDDHEAFRLRKLYKEDLQGGVYIPTHRGYFNNRINVQMTVGDVVKQFITPAINLGITLDENEMFVSIPMNMVDRFKKNGFINIYDWLENKLKTLPEKTELELKLGHFHVPTLGTEDSQYFKPFKLPEKSSENRLVKFLHEVNERFEIFASNSKTRQYYNLRKKLDSDYVPLVNPELECYTKLLRDYPLVKYIDHSTGKTINEFIRYVANAT